MDFTSVWRSSAILYVYDMPKPMWYWYQKQKGKNIIPISCDVYVCASHLILQNLNES